MSKSLIALAAGLAMVAADVPNTRICNHDGTCFLMPVLGEGSCCGNYSIPTWLNQGGIHIDTSMDYGSEPSIGQAVQASGIPRENLWITSKLNVEYCSTNMTQALYDQVLTPLNMTYVDLLLLHHSGRWLTDNDPRPACWDASLAGPAGPGSYYNCRMQTVQAFEALRAQGLVKVWGVSNWNVRDLQQMYDQYGYYPPINQIEMHPYWQNREVVAFCNKHGILVEAYAPMGDGDRSHMRDDPIFPPIAAAHNATIGQVILNWELQTGADIVIPRSSQAFHQTENLAMFNPLFTLNETEIAAIQSCKTNMTKIYHTDCQPWC